MTSMVRARALVLGALMLLLASMLAPAATVAQDARTESVSEAAIEMSRLERSGDLLTLHDMLQPDVRLVVSRAALELWYQGPDAVIPTQDPEILSVEFGSWAWPVTGRTYADVATVTVRQPGVRQGEALDQVEIQHYWFDGSRWRWFFGADKGFIDNLEAQVTQDADMGSFPDIQYARINLVWSEIFADAGVTYTSPDAINSVTTLPVQTGCGRMTEQDYSEVFYCTLDHEIYYMVDFQQLMQRQFGPYAWPHIVSHEWGHHIQYLEGIDSSSNPELDGGIYDIELELQADCLAGVYAQEAVARGWLSEQELNDAYQISLFAADSPGTPFDDPMAHGTGQQRQQAFTNGLEDGLFGCNLDLTPAG